MYMCEVDTDDNMLILIWYVHVPIDQKMQCTCTHVHTLYLCIISSFFFKQRYKENMKRRDDEIKKLSTKYDIKGKEVICHWIRMVMEFLD